jgi:hypothetical protein
LAVEHPNESSLDTFVEKGWYLALALGFVGLFVGGPTESEPLFALVALAGLVFTARGVLMASNYRGVTDRMRARDDRRPESRMNRLLGVEMHTTRGQGLLLAVIGLGWTAMGTAVLIGGF